MAAIGLDFTQETVALINMIGIVLVALIAYFQGRNIKRVETNTNSIKDELVKATAELNRILGIAVGRAQVLAEQEEAKKNDQR